MNAVAESKSRQHNEAPQWTMVCRLVDLLPGAGTAATINNQPIAIFRLQDDSVFALDNVDPFSGASVMSRGIVGDIAGDPVVASPIYKQHFRLSDGSCVEDDSVSLASYRCVVTDGAVIVQVRQK